MNNYRQVHTHKTVQTTQNKTANYVLTLNATPCN